MVLSSGPSWAQPNDATRILKTMSDFIAMQQNVSITFDSDIEVITPDVQKIQFTNSGTVLMSRPDKLRATRTGGYSDVELFFDGRTATFVSKDDKVYTRLETPGSIDQLIGKLRNEFSLTAPGADLLLSNVYDDLMEGAIDAKHIGLGVIDGVECEHLAFRSTDVDWQIWIETGARPIPRKYVITSKGVGAAPQYTLRIKDWKTDALAGALVVLGAWDVFDVKEDNGGVVEFGSLEYDRSFTRRLATGLAATGLRGAENGKQQTPLRN
jgi:hypothetical protein